MSTSDERARSEAAVGLGKIPRGSRMMRTGIERITTPTELDGIFAGSRTKPVWVFKHSLVCGASAGALTQFRDFVGASAEPTYRFALIEIQNSREVSRALAERTGVRHQSPQVILLKDEQAVWHASHWDITARSLAEAAADALDRPPLNEKSV